MFLDIKFQGFIDLRYFLLEKKQVEHGNPIFPELLQIIRPVEPAESQFDNIPSDGCLLKIEVQLVPFDVISLFFLTRRTLQPALMSYIKHFYFLSLSLSRILQPQNIQF